MPAITFDEKPAKKGTPVFDTSGNVPTYDGHEQYGDIMLYPKETAHLADTLRNPTETAVKPGDLVYTPDPSKTFTFRPVDSRNNQEANVLRSRLRRKGFFEVLSDEFVSPTSRWSAPDGVFITDDPQTVWMAQPGERAHIEREKRFKIAAIRVKESHKDDNLRDADPEMEVTTDAAHEHRSASQK